MSSKTQHQSWPPKLSLMISLKGYGGAVLCYICLAPATHERRHHNSRLWNTKIWWRGSQAVTCRDLWFFFLPGHTPMISWLDAAAAPRIFSYNTSFLIACLPPYTQTWWILGYLFWFIWTPVPVQWLMLRIFVPDVYDIGVTVAPRPRHWGGPSLVKSILMFRGRGGDENGRY